MIHVAMVLFNNPKVIRETVRRFFDLTDLTGIEYKLHLVHAHYPLPSKTEVRDTIKAEALARDAEFWDLSKNYGQDGNINHVLATLKIDLEPHDGVLFWDSDHKPKDPRYLRAMMTISEVAPKCGFVTLWRDHLNYVPSFDMRAIQHPVKEYAGVKAHELTLQGGWPMFFFNTRFVDKCGYIPQSHSYYGGTEANIYQALKQGGLTGYMLHDFEDEMISVDFDPEYIAWKKSVIQHNKHPDFSDWLHGGGK